MLKNIDFPKGKYLFVTNSVRPSYGGLTRSIFNRASAFHTAAGIESLVLTVDAFPYYDDVRNVWKSEGVITAGVSLLNIHEYYRDKNYTDGLGGGVSYPDDLVSPDGGHCVVDSTPGGKPWRSRTLDESSGETILVDYLRVDGSPYMRTRQAPGRSEWGGPARRIALFDETGRVVSVFSGHREWFASWIAELSGTERTFIVTDVQDPELHLLATGPQYFNFGFAHGPHTNYPREWNSTLTNLWAGVEDRLYCYDGVISLTEWQKSDLEVRWGRRNNFFVVPHALAGSTTSENDSRRDPHRAVVVARLSREKRLDDAIRAFAIVVREFPDAELDIFGDGPDRESLESLIQELGIVSNVRLLGHQGHAKDSSLTASAFLMTSRFEGQPMAVLEAQARGCPVVAYDVKYGPRACVVDGETGLLVPDGEIEAFASNVCSLFRSPEEVKRMSDNAIAVSGGYDLLAFVEKWKSVFETSILNRPRRIGISNGSFTVDVETIASKATDSFMQSNGASKEIKIDGLLEVYGDYGTGVPFALDVEMRVVREGTAEYLSVPIETEVFLNVPVRVNIRIGIGSLMRSFSETSPALGMEVRIVGSNDGVSFMPVIDMGCGAVVATQFSDRGYMSLHVIGR